jgi:hypothetical protein
VVSLLLRSAKILRMVSKTPSRFSTTILFSKRITCTLSLLKKAVRRASYSALPELKWPSPVQLHGQSTFGTKEIHDVAADAVLSPELHAVKLGALQVLPGDSFGWGEGAP